MNGQALNSQIVLSVYDVHGNWLGESAFASNSLNEMGNVSFLAIGSEAAGILNNQIFSRVPTRIENDNRPERFHPQSRTDATGSNHQTAGR